MNAVLLSRDHGSIGPQSIQRYYTARLLHGLQLVPSVEFDGTILRIAGHEQSSKRKAQDADTLSKPAHPTGVNALTIDDCKTSDSPNGR